MVYYRPQRSWAKVMFLQASVILSRGGGLPQCMLGYHPLGADTPRSRHPPPDQTPLPPGADTPPEQTQAPPPDQTPPSPGSRRQHTVNERPVRILLECILVKYLINLIRAMSLVTSSGGFKGVAPYGPKFSLSHAVFQKIYGKIIFSCPLWRVGAPSTGNPGSAPDITVLTLTSV